MTGEVHLDVDGTSAYAWLTVAGVEFGFHQADDERNPRGRIPGRVACLPHITHADLRRSPRAATVATP